MIAVLLVVFQNDQHVLKPGWPEIHSLRTQFSEPNRQGARPLRIGFHDLNCVKRQYFQIRLRVNRSDRHGVQGPGLAVQVLDVFKLWVCFLIMIILRFHGENRFEWSDWMGWDGIAV